MTTLSQRCVIANQNAAINNSMIKSFGKKEREEFIRRSMERDAKHASSFDVGLDVMINGMLSGTGTATVNVVSMFIQSLLKLTNTSIGAMTDSIGFTQGGREWRQVKAMWDASLEGFGHDGNYFREGFRKGYSLERDINVRQLGMKQKDFNVFLKDVMGIDDPKLMNIDQIEDLMLDMQDYMHNSIGKTRVGGTFIEGTVRFPTKLIVGIDEYGKARFRRQSMAQMISKFASEDEKLGMGSYDDLYKKYKEELFTGEASDTRWDVRIKQFVTQRAVNQEKAGVRKPSVDEALKESRLAVDLVRNDALFNAFQQKLAGNPRKVQEFRHKHPAFALFAPFIKTPWNIVKEGYNYIPIIPALKIQGKGALSKINIDLRTNVIPLHGPAEKMSYDELIPRQIIGMSMFAFVGAMFDDERITGSIPRSPAERQRWKDTGVMPYSIKIGDKWIGYHRFEPIATPLSMATDLFTFTKEYMDDDDVNTEEAVELTANLLYAVKANLTSKTFLEGIHSLTEAMVDPSAKTGSDLVETALRPMTPAIMAQTAKMIDGYERQTEDVWERLQSRIPVLREQLPQQYGVYGDPKTVDFGQALTSIKVFDEDQLTPVQKEMSRVKWDKGGITNRGAVKLSSEQLANLRQINAEYLTPALKSIIEGDGYKNASDKMKRKMLDLTSSRMRTRINKAYMAKLYQTDPEFAKKWMSAQYDKKGVDVPEEYRD